MYNGTSFAMNFFGVHERTVNREVYYTPEGSIDFDKTPKENLVVFDGVYGSFNADGTPNSSGISNSSKISSSVTTLLSKKSKLTSTLGA